MNCSRDLKINLDNNFSHSKSEQFSKQNTINTNVLWEWEKSIMSTPYGLSFHFPKSFQNEKYAHHLISIGRTSFEKWVENQLILLTRVVRVIWFQTKSFSRSTISLGVKNYRIDGLFWSKIFVIKSQKSLGIKKVNKCNE